jgi:hypothetical protein
MKIIQFFFIILGFLKPSFINSVQNESFSNIIICKNYFPINKLESSYF